MTGAYDVVVIGGGAAGLSAALVLGRARRHVLVVDAAEPRNAPAAHMQGFLSRDGMPPSELLAVGKAELASYGVEVVDGRVSELSFGFEVRLADGREFKARRVLVATGLHDELPHIPGIRERWGRDVLHCPYCHGWEVRDQPIGVLGTNQEAVQHALLIAQWSSDVLFFTHTHTLSPVEEVLLRARGIVVVPGEVTALAIADDHLAGVEVDGHRTVPRSAVFIRPQMAPNEPRLLADLGCTFSPTGFVEVDGTGMTSVPGVWAAGNAADPRAQVITAAGEGSAAAIAINADLVAEDVALALDASALTGAGRRR